MNLTLHIVRKDLVRMRVWIACWVALLLGPLAIGAWLIGHEPFTGNDWDLPNKIAIFTGVEAFVGYLLTILIIQEDSVVGTQQFWLTRPISRGRLLGAKMISAFVIVGLVPIAVSLPWWLWCGFGLGQIASAAAEMLLISIIAMLPAAVVAVLTDSLARALLWSVAVVAVVMFVGFFFAVANAAMTVRDSGEMLLTVARVELAVSGLALEMAALVVVQFLVRRRGWWLAGWAGLMVTTLLVASQWRWSWISPIPHEHDAELASGVKVQFHRAIAAPQPDRPNGLVKLQRVGAQLVVSGNPPSGMLVGAASQQHWTWPGGPSIERIEHFYSEVGSASLFGLRTGTTDPETKRAEVEHLKRRTAREFGLDEFYAEASAWLPPSFVARMRTEPPKFEARLWWQVMRPELQLEVPLAPSRWTARHGHGVGIQRIQTKDDALSLTMVATRPFLLTSALRALHEPHRRFGIDNQQAWALFDRKRGRVVDMFGEWSMDKPRSILVHGVKIEWRVHTSHGPGIYRNGKWMREPGWMTATSLAVVTRHEDAVFSREVAAERFEPAN